jgi:cyclophilin family peptidyl-prolyl cis-trans isomerase
MGRDSRKAREKQLRRDAARRRAERKRLRKKRFLIGAVVGALVIFLGLGGTIGILAALNKPKPKPSPPPAASASPVAKLCPETPPKNTSPKNKQSTAPKMTIDKNATYVATWVTSCGTIKVDLLAKQSPITVNNFVSLARGGWYDGTLFHRINNQIQIIQGGDPNCTSIIGTAAAMGQTQCGMGGPGYSIPDELSSGLKMKVGSLAMANSGPNTGGSQFFFVTGQAGTSLPNNYTIFGQATKQSLPALQKIQSVPVGGLNGDTPLEKVWIYKVTIQEIKK